MQPLPIIKHLDDLGHLRAGFLPRVGIPAMDQLVLEGAEEALPPTLSSQVPLGLILATRRWWARSC